MNLHEKVEQQYKVVEMYESANATTEMLVDALEDLLEEFKSGERDPITLVNEMKGVIDGLYLGEYEKATLAKVIKIVWEETAC